MTRRSRMAWGGAALAIAATGLVIAVESRQPREFADRFERGALGDAWTFTISGDLSEQAIDIVREPGTANGRLRLRAGTLGTRDDSVKFLGVRTTEPIPMERGVRVTAVLDWNGQANGSYLSSELIVSPSGIVGNPLERPDWIRVGYVGVPPGRNARMVVAASVDGRIRTLFDEGWPDENTTGRLIGRQRVTLQLLDGRIEVTENGSPVFSGALKQATRRPVYVYLQMSSHSNYAPRELFFDDVSVVSL